MVPFDGVEIPPFGLVFFAIQVPSARVPAGGVVKAPDSSAMRTGSAVWGSRLVVMSQEGTVRGSGSNAGASGGGEGLAASGGALASARASVGEAGGEGVGEEQARGRAAALPRARARDPKLSAILMSGG